MFFCTIIIIILKLVRPALEFGIHFNNQIFFSMSDFCLLKMHNQQSCSNSDGSRLPRALSKNFIWEVQLPVKLQSTTIHYNYTDLCLNIFNLGLVMQGAFSTTCYIINSHFLHFNSIRAFMLTDY